MNEKLRPSPPTPPDSGDTAVSLQSLTLHPQIPLRELTS